MTGSLSESSLGGDVGVEVRVKGKVVAGRVAIGSHPGSVSRMLEIIKRGENKLKSLKLIMDS